MLLLVSPLSEPSRAVSAARRNFWGHFETYEALMRELTPEARLLLSWEHSRLAELACLEGLGKFSEPSCALRLCLHDPGPCTSVKERVLKSAKADTVPCCITGPECTAESAAAPELRTLLRARERAYIVAVAALNVGEKCQTHLTRLHSQVSIWTACALCEQHALLPSLKPQAASRMVH